MRTNRRRLAKLLKILPYIEGSSNQYIDTGVIPFKDIDFHYDIEYTSIKVTNPNVSVPTFGVCGSTFGWQKESFYVLYRDDKKILNIRSWNKGVNNNRTEDCPFLPGRFQIRMSFLRWELIQNGISQKYQQLTGATAFPNLTIYIGNKHEMKNNVNNMEGFYKIYGCKIYNGTLLIRNFIPANYSGTNGMLETISNKFYRLKSLIYDK